MVPIPETGSGAAHRRFILSIELAEEVNADESPVTHLRDVKVIYLIRSRGELYFCKNCATGCLEKEICTLTAVVSMAYDSKERFNETFGRIEWVEPIKLPFDEAWEFVRKCAASAHPGKAAYFYLFHAGSPETTSLHMVYGGAKPPEDV